MEASEVAKAIGINSSAEVPSIGSKYTRAGTIIRPPPIPSKPARKPTSAPNSKQLKNTENIIVYNLKSYSSNIREYTGFKPLMTLVL